MFDRAIANIGSALFASLFALGPAAAAEQPARQVLSATVGPVHYDLSLVPNAEALTFTGNEAIQIEVSAPTQDIVLNAVGLDFDSVSLDGHKAEDVVPDATLGQVTLRFASSISAGSHRLAIAYHGKIRLQTLGFFAMDYDTPQGKRRTLATNFEPAAARELLPCWDEPGRKATFTVTVDSPKDRMAVSNMPVAQITPLSATMQRVRFQTSPKMSTYLLFLTIGDYERIHQEVAGVDVGVVVKRGDTEKAHFALSEAVRLLPYYNHYFGVRYPLPKLDLIAAPGKIDGGSMENWGANFYSQEHLLLDPAKGTSADRQLVFLVVSHEMAHQWFGDLVTMQWWDDLWLNEGFARWMQTYAADALHPEWQTGLQALDIFERGKQLDALPSTHPVLQKVMTADQAMQALDNITYDKGAAVINMINAYIGPDRFREGVQRYMKRYAYANTVDTDLWSIMQDVAGKPILKIESDFTRQPGLPLIGMTAKAGGFQLDQGRVFANPDQAASEPVQKWTMPISVAKPGGGDRTMLLPGEAAVPFAAPVLVNAEQQAYARVLYPEPAFDALLQTVPQLPPVDQYGLLNDSYCLGLYGYSDAARVLALAAKMPPSAEPIVWSRVISILTALDLRYEDGPARTRFQKFALGLLQPVAGGLGAPSPNEGTNIQDLRSSLARALGRFGDTAVIASARRTVGDGTGTAAQQRTALEVAAASADDATFSELVDRASKTYDPLEKQQIYMALSSVRDPALARRVVAAVLNGAVPAGTAAAILAGVAREHPGIGWKEIVPQLDNPAAAIVRDAQWRLVVAIAGLSSDPRTISEVRAYTDKNVPVDARKPFDGAVAEIEMNQRVASTVIPQLDDWISKGVGGAR
jgi:aminopeptidase N